MTAAEVRASLALRWPDTDYLSIEEAPEDSGRAGRKIDLLVIALWASRGLERDAVEIKVSYSDWTRERQSAEKADFWWRHSHRFWLALPAELVDKVRPELPTTWGLLSCVAGAAPKVIVKAEKHAAEPLSWGTMVGVMRALSGCSVNALHRAEQRGRHAGVEEGKRIAERQSGDDYLREELKQLRERVAEFERASGLNISRYYHVQGMGELVAMIQREKADPGWLVRTAGSAARIAAQQAEHAAAEAKKVGAALERIGELLAASQQEEAA